MVTTLLYLCLSEKKSETQQPSATSPTSSCEGTSCANDTKCHLEPSYMAISTDVNSKGEADIAFIQAHPRRLFQALCFTD